MATKKAKKFGMGGLSNAVRAAANKAASQIPMRSNQSAQDEAARAAMQKVNPRTPQSSAMGAKLAAQMADQRAGQEKLANAAAGSARAQMLMKKYEPQPTATRARPTGLGSIAKSVTSPTAKPAIAGTVNAITKKITPFMKKGGSVKHSDVAMDKKVVKKAVKMHDDQLHGGKKTNLTKLKSGGSIDGCAIRGKTKTSMIKMKKGGSC
jgi:hypothetical protein